MRIFIIVLLSLFVTACTITVDTPPTKVVNLITVGSSQSTDVSRDPGLTDRQLADYVYESQFCDMPTLNHLLNIPVPDKASYKANQDPQGYVEAMKEFISEYERLSLIVEKEYRSCH